MGTLVGPIIGASVSQIIQQFFYTWFGARWPLVFGLLFMATLFFLALWDCRHRRLKRMDIKNGWDRFKSMFANKQESET